jgi:hypothetical protein
MEVKLGLSYAEMGNHFGVTEDRALSKIFGHKKRVIKITYKIKQKLPLA